MVSESIICTSPPIWLTQLITFSVIPTPSTSSTSDMCAASEVKPKKQQQHQKKKTNIKKYKPVFLRQISPPENVAETPLLTVQLHCCRVHLRRRTGGYTQAPTADRFVPLWHPDHRNNIFLAMKNQKRQINLCEKTDRLFLYYKGLLSEFFFYHEVMRSAVSLSFWLRFPLPLS